MLHFEGNNAAVCLRVSPKPKTNSHTMNEAIELHDSRLVDIKSERRKVIISLSPAFIHRSTGRPGLDAGSVWTQDVNLTISTANTVVLPNFPIRISDGMLRVETQQHQNLIPAPSNLSGEISLHLVLMDSEDITISGNRITTALVGPASYLEEFPEIHGN